MSLNESIRSSNAEPISERGNMNIRIGRILRAMLLASVLLTADSADAGYIWRVNYTQPSLNSLNGKVETHVLATDQSFGSSGADYWNEVLPVPATQTLMETSVAGGGAPSITFVGQATSSTSSGNPMSGEPIDDELDNWAARFRPNVVDWELRDLDPRTFYNLVFYDLDSLTASITLKTEFDSDGDGVLDQTDTIVWDIGDDFSLFQGVQSDDAGVIRGRWTGSSEFFVDVAGFQVAESIPETIDSGLPSIPLLLLYD